MQGGGCGPYARDISGLAGACPLRVFARTCACRLGRAHDACIQVQACERSRVTYASLCPRARSSAVRWSAQVPLAPQSHRRPTAAGPGLAALLGRLPAPAQADLSRSPHPVIPQRRGSWLMPRGRARAEGAFFMRWPQGRRRGAAAAAGRASQPAGVGATQHARLQPRRGGPPLGGGGPLAHSAQGFAGLAVGWGLRPGGAARRARSQ